jgi:hypothetical protein
MKFYILAFLLCVPFICVANEKTITNKDNLSQKEITELRDQYPHTETDRLLKELENYESYRPNSSTDTTRNPFQKKRYQFDLEVVK